MKEWDAESIKEKLAELKEQNVFKIKTNPSCANISIKHVNNPSIHLSILENQNPSFDPKSSPTISLTNQRVKLGNFTESPSRVPGHARNEITSGSGGKIDTNILGASETFSLPGMVKQSSSSNSSPTIYMPVQIIKSNITVVSESSSSSSGELCVICCIQRQNAVNMPCCHGSFCVDCSLKILAQDDNCMICRKKVSQLVELEFVPSNQQLQRDIFRVKKAYVFVKEQEVEFSSIDKRMIGGMENQQNDNEEEKEMQPDNLSDLQEIESFEEIMSEKDSEDESEIQEVVMRVKNHKNIN